jgi:hypothetical protein
VWSEANIGAPGFIPLQFPVLKAEKILQKT